MRTIDLLYQAYVDERMESAESGEEQEAIRQFRNICSKADNSLMKLQGDIWDSMVQYGVPDNQINKSFRSFPYNYSICFPV